MTTAPIRVLIAEDHLIARVGLGTIVETQPDMQVVAEAATGTEAVQLHAQISIVAAAGGGPDDDHVPRDPVGVDHAAHPFPASPDSSAAPPGPRAPACVGARSTGRLSWRILRTASALAFARAARRRYASMDAGEYKFSSLILAVVASDAFQKRSAPREAAEASATGKEAKP